MHRWIVHLSRDLYTLHQRVNCRDPFRPSYTSVRQSIRDFSFLVPNTGVQTPLWLFERPLKDCQIESHGTGSDDKTDQETGGLESHAEQSKDKRVDPTRNKKLVPLVVLSTSTVNLLAELCESLSVSFHTHSNTVLRTSYNHVGAFPPVCPEHQRFFQCATGDDFDKLQDLNEVGLIPYGIGILE
jgi:hypothetical protein